ncbi:MAG: hypothetical protein LUE89_10925 [Clostridiales bacterium]|nr:hypothetical protein [Clostridiales bacterium]
MNAQLFVDHYEAGGWMRGNTKIKSWKACVRTWTQRQEGRANQSAPPPQQEILTAANWED